MDAASSDNRSHNKTLGPWKNVPMKIRSFSRVAVTILGMAAVSRDAFALPIAPLAQVPGSLRDGFQAGLGILFLIGFFWGVITIWGGAQKLKNGDSDGKMGVVSGIVIAGAAAIMGALFTIFGMNGGVLTPTF